MNNDSLMKTKQVKQ